MNRRHYSLEELESLPTLCVGQAENLKVEQPGFRVWLSRCGLEDGEPFNNAVSIEEHIDGAWKVTERYPAS